MACPKLLCTTSRPLSHVDSCRWLPGAVKRSSHSRWPRDVAKYEPIHLSGTADNHIKAYLEELCEAADCLPKVAVYDQRPPEPSGQLPLVAGRHEALVTQQDGPKVVPVADDAPHGLVDCAGRLLHVPLLACVWVWCMGTKRGT